MSSKRPGTVDYSKWDNLDVSDDEDKEDDLMEYENEEEAEEDSDDASMEYDEDEDEESSDESAIEKDQSSVSKIPDATLATLQRAWQVDSLEAVQADTPKNDTNRSTGEPATMPTHIGIATTSAASVARENRFCASCFTPGPSSRCSRCQMVWFCNRTCQVAYHPVHKSECIDANQHFQYWGFLSKNTGGGITNNISNNNNHSLLSPEQRRKALENALLARVDLRRRKALKQAAAKEAVERARRTREARGHQVKGGDNKGKGNAEREETCSVCQCEFTVAGDGGAGLCCPSSHFMCNECAGVYCKSVVDDIHVSYPPKCPMCRALMPMDHFQAQLDTKQLAAVKTHAAEIALKPNEMLARCQKCDYFEVETKPGSVVWWCAACGYGNCFVCNKDLPRGVLKYDLTKSPHALCGSLRFIKSKVEKAIEEGSQMQCPACGLSGRKDDACTHMSCPKCLLEWCYVCGVGVADCDKAPPRAGRPVNDIYLHNKDWESNERRCPMYLTQILEVDLSWLGDDWENRISDEDFEDDEKCLDHFHRFRTIQKLQEVLQETGLRDFQAVFEHFESIRNAGYTIDEIIETSTDCLIDRSGFMGNAEVDDDDDEDRGSDIEQSEQDEFAELPEEMTRTTAQEEADVRHAVDASHISAQEDEIFRAALTASSHDI